MNDEVRGQRYNICNWEFQTYFNISISFHIVLKYWLTKYEIVSVFQSMFQCYLCIVTNISLLCKLQNNISCICGITIPNHQRQTVKTVLRAQFPRLVWFCFFSRFRRCTISVTGFMESKKGQVCQYKWHPTPHRHSIHLQWYQTHIIRTLTIVSRNIFGLEWNWHVDGSKRFLISISATIWRYGLHSSCRKVCDVLVD